MSKASIETDMRDYGLTAQDFNSNIKVNIEPNGCETHLVVKIEDAKKYLTLKEQSALDEMLCKIEAGREKDGKTRVNHYYICNKDELYAQDVWKAIQKGLSESGQMHDALLCGTAESGKSRDFSDVMRGMHQ